MDQDVLVLLASAVRAQMDLIDETYDKLEERPAAAAGAGRGEVLGTAGGTLADHGVGYRNPTYTRDGLASG